MRESIFSDRFPERSNWERIRKKEKEKKRKRSTSFFGRPDPPSLRQSATPRRSIKDTLKGKRGKRREDVAGDIRILQHEPFP